MPSFVYRSRSIASAACFAATLLALSFSVAHAAEGGDDRSLYLPLDPIITNLAASEQSMPLARAVKLIAPLSAAMPAHKAPVDDLQSLQQADADSASGSVRTAQPAADPIDAEQGSDDGGTHYLRAQISLRFPTLQAKEDAQTRIPEIRSRILLLLSARSPGQLKTAAQKEALASAITLLARAPGDRDEPPHQVSSALITDFIVQ